jgi:hypothetical protein
MTLSCPDCPLPDIAFHGGMRVRGQFGVGFYCEDRNFGPLYKIVFLKLGNLINLHKTILAHHSYQPDTIHQLLRAYIIAIPQALSLEKNFIIIIGLELNLISDIL